MGRDAEFSEFVVKNRRRLLRAAFLMSGDWHLAEDAVQSALVKLYLAWPRIDGRLGPDGYAHTILFRVVADHRRRPWWREEPREPAHLSDEPAGTDSDFSADKLTLQQVLLSLPRRQRQVVILRFLNGYSIEETAAILGIGPGSVKSHTSRGLHRLKELLEPVPPTPMRGMTR